MWLLESTKFTLWKSGTNEVLWCHGVPGADITVLAGVVVEHLQRTLPSNVSAVPYIYCIYKEG